MRTPTGDGRGLFSCREPLGQPFVAEEWQVSAEKV